MRCDGLLDNQNARHVYFITLLCYSMLSHAISYYVSRFRFILFESSLTPSLA